jgi:N-acetylmuramoyl-L-alanine amidase
VQKKHRKNSITRRLAGLLATLVVLVGVAWNLNVFSQVSQFASVFFVDSSTPDSLHVAYAAAKQGGQKFKVLIVPGHDNAASGASFGGVREADLTLAEGTLLAAQFAKDQNIEVRLTRTNVGYDPELATYFSTHRQDIIDYRAAQTKLMKGYMGSGDIQSDVIVDHNKAPDEVAIKLYGINRWANEHGYNLIIHIHFNDIPRTNRAKPGAYTGFAVYVPEHQFSNAKGSMAVAQAIKQRLAAMWHVSTLPAESKSPVEDQGLIATGSNNSVDASSVLIEYAYIYESAIQSTASRQATLQAMAAQTYAGVEDFLGVPTLVIK